MPQIPLKAQKNNHKYIGIFADNEKENIILRIRDNAGGIPAAVVSKIFEPFFTTNLKVRRFWNWAIYGKNDCQRKYWW